VGPDPDPCLGQPGGHVGRGHALHVDQERRHAAVHAGPPVHGDRFGQAVEEPLAQRALVGHDRGEAPDRVQVVDGGVEPREQLVRQRAGLEAAPQRAGRRRPGLVGPPPLDHLGPPVGHAEMRTAELVRRADQHVRPDVADVDRLVRRVMDGVHPGQRPGLVRKPAHPAGVGDCADRVRGPGERDHLGARSELALQVREVQGRVVAQFDVPDHQITVVRDLQPGRHARVVVQARDEDLVTRAERAGSRPGQREVERGHVRPEDHFPGLAAQEPGRLTLGLGQDLADPDAGGVARAEVGAGLPERAGDRVTDLVGDLRAARGVEEGETLPQRREASPDRRDVHACAEHLGHRTLPPATARDRPPPVDIEFTTASPTKSIPLALAQTALRLPGPVGTATRSARAPLARSGRPDRHGRPRGTAGRYRRPAAGSPSPRPGPARGRARAACWPARRAAERTC